jgi:6-phosphogluconolactonase (cycloisomerase 2 family)
MAITLNGTTGVTTPAVSGDGSGLTALPSAQLTGALPAISGAALTGINTESFKPVAVTGATPSLNVGSYNYFSGSTFNADTTISFASVPTNARWTYSAPIVAASGYNLAGAVRDSSYIEINASNPSPTDIAFSPDGIYMYIMDDNADNVGQYTLSTAWDVATAVYTRSFGVSGEDTVMTGVEFSPDGIYMYSCGTTSQASVMQYTLSTAWNISTATFTRSFVVSSQDTSPRAIRFKPDGTRMFIVGNSGDDIQGYNLSTAWNISTASVSSDKYIGDEEFIPLALAFSSDGYKMFVMGTGTDSIFEYNLGTAWLVSSAVYNQISLYIQQYESSPQGLTFSADGDKMYFVGNDRDTVYQYSTDGFATITLPAACSHTPTPTYVAGKRLTLEFATLNGGTTVDVIQASVS